jgi:hypothetical protein
MPQGFSIHEHRQYVLVSFVASMACTIPFVKCFEVRGGGGGGGACIKTGTNTSLKGEKNYGRVDLERLIGGEKRHETSFSRERVSFSSWSIHPSTDYSYVHNLLEDREIHRKKEKQLGTI